MGDTLARCYDPALFYLRLSLAETYMLEIL